MAVVIKNWHKIYVNLIDLEPKLRNIKRLDDGRGLEETLKANEAAYHRSCYLKYNDDKVKRASKRKSQELAQSLSPVKTNKKNFSRRCL